MSLQPQAIPPIPEETIRVARAILPKGNIFIQMRDELGTFFRDEDFLDLFSEKGQPAESAWRLALVMVMQYAVNACVNLRRNNFDPPSHFLSNVDNLKGSLSHLFCHSVDHRCDHPTLRQVVRPAAPHASTRSLRMPTEQGPSALDRPGSALFNADISAPTFLDPNADEAQRQLTFDPLLSR